MPSLVQAQSVASRRPKVAFVYVGPVGDGGWTFSHEQGRQQAEAALGDRVDFTTVEKVPEGDAGEPVLRELVAQGHQLIVATAFGYMVPLMKLAAQHPAVRFEHAMGYRRSSNLRTYDIRMYEGAYLAGIVAGARSRSGRIGVVGAIPIPDVIRNINAFTLGVQSVSTDVKVSVAWANTWFDPPREAALAAVLMEAGADVLFQTTDSAEVIKAAQARGRHAIGIDSDMSAYGPDAHLGSVAALWGPYYIHAIRQFLDREWTSRHTWWGLPEGSTDLVGLHPDLPDDLRVRVDDARGRMATRQFNIWRGPIEDRSGRRRAALGQALTDAQLTVMDYFVPGIEGPLTSP